LIYIPSFSYFIIFCSDNGDATIDGKVPQGRLTQWIGTAVCLNDEDGLGVSAPATLTVIQPLMLSMTLPYSAIKAEELQVKLTVWNSLTKCMAVSMLSHIL